MSVRLYYVRQKQLLLASLVISSLITAGCQSPHRADRGALVGGLTGAGIGALVGDAVGKPVAGAALGAGVGAITGAAVGQSIDDIEARNRAEIEARLGRPVSASPVGIRDVISMAQAGVDDEIIVNHIKSHGVNRSLQTEDLILLKSNGVSPRVITTMQTPPTRPVVVQQAAPRPVIVEEHYYHDPWHSPRPRVRFRHRHHRRHRDPRVSWGVTFGSDL